MAEIRIPCIGPLSSGLHGAVMPSVIDAVEDWPGGGVTQIVSIALGQDRVVLTMVSAEQLRQLANELLDVADRWKGK